MRYEAGGEKRLKQRIHNAADEKQTNGLTGQETQANQIGEQQQKQQPGRGENKKL
jgi:hypothetical protein